MRTAHPVAVVALYVVVSCGVLAIVMEALRWWFRWFPRRPRGPITTGEYRIDELRRVARLRAAEYHARRTGGAT